MFKNENLSVPKIIDDIEKNIYLELKPLGFRKYGRTLHRFVSDDISQVINFQCGQSYCGETHLMWVNYGIRVPECFDKEFFPSKPFKKYYHEYECNIRFRLSDAQLEKERTFNLFKEDTNTIIEEIIKNIKDNILPMFEILSTREAILEHRRDYKEFSKNLILLEECMIYGHLGNLEKAKKLFEEHYQNAIKQYNDATINGRKEYLKKGERIILMNQDITAEEDGYVTIYGMSHGHIDYLDELAIKLDFKKF